MLCAMFGIYVQQCDTPFEQLHNSRLRVFQDIESNFSIQRIPEAGRVGFCQALCQTQRLR